MTAAILGSALSVSIRSQSPATQSSVTPTAVAGRVVTDESGQLLRNARITISSDAPGFDITDRPLPFGRADQSVAGIDVVLTNRVSKLTGVVNRDGARPAPNVSVVAFSTDRNRWYSSSRFLRKTGTDTEGRFAIEGLPFGSYYVAALAQLPQDGDEAWQDPALLESLIARASSSLIRDGETSSVSIDLR